MPHVSAIGPEVRKDFPFFGHNPGVTYLDSAATSLTPQPVIDAVNRYYSEYSVNIHRGIYAASMAATNLFEEARERVRAFLNLPDSHEVIFTSGTTASLNLLAYSLSGVTGELTDHFPAWNKPLSEGDIILISESEHHANIVPWQIAAERSGAQVAFIPIHANGTLDTSFLTTLSAARVKIVSLSAVSNVTGIRHDLDPFVNFARDKGAIFITDGAQSVCHGRTDLSATGFDFFAFSAHKLLGPTGIGVLTGPREVLSVMPPFLGGGDMIRVVRKTGTTYNEPPHRFEAGTPHIAGAFGLHAAIDYLEQTGIEAAEQKEQELLLYGLEKFAQAGIRVFGPSAEDIASGRFSKTGVLAFEVPGVHPHDLGTLLDDEGIAIRVGHHCCQLLMNAFEVTATARASLYFYNETSDLDKLMSAIARARRILIR